MVKLPGREKHRDISSRGALRFVVLIGVVSLFADMTYEAARSLNGPYLAYLGASAAAVGVIAGLGELVGYGLRIISGYISDRTGKYWLITSLGYTINLLAVPLLALTGHWMTAAVLMVTERIGKAIRTPARDVMLSHAGKEIGSGWAFGLHEFMDQIGAVSGPLIIAGVFYFKGGYQLGYAVLVAPAILALTALFIARLMYPRPRVFETALPEADSDGKQSVFWLYMVAVAFIAVGYADFPLIAFHFKKTAAVSENLIPLFYAVAMATDAVAALLFGRLFDRMGIFTLMIGVSFSSLFAPLVFFGGPKSALVGMAFWGIGMGAQESVMRATIAELAPADKRGLAFGIFNTGYGLFWFLGSALMGILYDVSIGALVVVSVVMQVASIIILIRTKYIQP
ncbi:MAG: MFS transporter [Deltaproteobacteria bacterium]|nr:MAG: MFS transporter [Deltaproteobacteria bacterium]